MATSFIRWFNDISINDVATVGGKNASLGEMYRELTSKGIKVPPGFAVTAEGYRYFMDSQNLNAVLKDHLSDLKYGSSADLHRRGHIIRHAILAAKLPDDLSQEILQAYHKMNEGGEPFDVAVRSSATAEDLPDASFAGQQETYLNIHGDAALLDACKRCIASLFTDRAISYRLDKGFEHFKVALSIGVQKMVRSDEACSGVMFTLDTESGFRNAILINAAWGLGETIVQGIVNPDEFYVFKPGLLAGKRPILKKKLGSKEVKLIYDTSGAKHVKTVAVSEKERKTFALSDDEILLLARWGCIIEDHYSQKNGKPTPMDIEWAKDGLTGEFYIVQARPETVQSQKATDKFLLHHLNKKSRVLIAGQSVGDKIGQGRVRVVESAKDLDQIQAGDVLVTNRTDPDWEPAMKRSAAIITDRGGRTCHAAIVSRELGIPAVIGTGKGTQVLKDNQEVTVSCAEGEQGFVYEGILPFEVKEVSIQEEYRPFTNIMMNIANPDEAFHLAMLPNDGVGLVRIEFIISNSIQIHPMALLAFDRLEDPKAKERIRKLTEGYEKRRSDYFVDHLAQGVAMITAAFWPKDVIVRLSDFKTNEYANLIGGKQFEPHEENPMIGFRGASRYYSPHYRDGFALECLALKRVREDMGLSNLKVMIPFCRTVAEGRKVLSEMEKHGLKRGENGLEVYVMCEIPSNVVLADKFADLFDGFSIGSNDLTQLILGIDRDSELLSDLFDERNDAVKLMITQVIETAKKRNKKIGICGQAPSDYPDFAVYLLEQGIDSISLNPDVMLKMTHFMQTMEDRIHDR
ncbi:MAG: phosphoenolpyruvate synthase [Oligoflexus sp.]